MNICNTKKVVFSKTNKNIVLTVNCMGIKQVSTFKYVSALIKQNCDLKREIKSRIDQAWKIFTDRNWTWNSECTPIRLHELDPWPSNRKEDRGISNIPLSTQTRISWTLKVSIAEVLGRTHKHKELLLAIIERKTQYLEPIIRGSRYEILRLIIDKRKLVTSTSYHSQ